MKIVFFGTGKFGLPALKKLAGSNHEIAAVATQPDAKKGRGHNVQPTLIKAFIEQTAPAIDVFQPPDISDNAFLDSLRGKDADMFVVVDYSQLLRKGLLDMPKRYCINLHPSLLPKYRGAAPVNWAILNGEEVTGNTVIKMVERMDAGEVIMQEEIKIADDENAAELSDRLSQSGAELILKTLDIIERGQEHFLKQDEDAVTYARKLQKKDGEIDWATPAMDIVRKVKGMQPWPGAFTYLNRKRLKIIEACVSDSEKEEVIGGIVCDEKKIVIGTAKGALSVKVLQFEGKKIMGADEFLRGYSLKKGTVLGG